MSDYTYSFAKGGKRYQCDKCGSSDGYQYFIDNSTGEVLPPVYGKCHACSYLNLPKTKGMTRHKVQALKNESFLMELNKPKDRLNIPVSVYEKWLIDKSKPVPKFFEIFVKVIGLNKVHELISLYRIGLVPKQVNYTYLFPYINVDNDIRAVQVKQFNDVNKTTINSWIHAKEYARVCGLPNEWISRYRNEHKVTCMMGEHLISQYPKRNVIIHESLKNALYWTAHVGVPSKHNEAPIQLATGSLSYLNIDKIKQISSGTYRNLILMPDPEDKAVKSWTKIYEDIETYLSPEWNVSLIDLRQEIKNLPAGYDIADLLYEQWNRKDIPIKQSKKHTPRNEPVSQGATIEPKLSNPTKVDAKPLQSIKSDISKPAVKKNYRIEVNGKVSYIKGTTRLIDLPAKSVVTLREPKQWRRYNLFKLFNESTGGREVVKMPFYIPDEALISEMDGDGWIIDTKVEVDATIKPVVKKHAPRSEPVSQVATIEPKLSNPTKVDAKPLQSIKQGYNKFHLYNDLTGKQEVKIIPDYIPDKSVIEGMPGNGWRIKRMVEQ